MSDTRFFLSLLAFARSPGQAGGRALVFSYATLLLFRRAQRPFSSFNARSDPAQRPWRMPVKVRASRGSNLPPPCRGELGLAATRRSGGRPPPSRIPSQGRARAGRGERASQPASRPAWLGLAWPGLAWPGLA